MASAHYTYWNNDLIQHTNSCISIFFLNCCLLARSNQTFISPEHLDARPLSALLCPLYSCSVLHAPPPSSSLGVSDCQRPSVSHMVAHVSVGAVGSFALFPVETNCVLKTHEMYHCLLLNAFRHHHHLLFDWLSYSDHTHTHTLICTGRQQKSSSLQSWLPKF